MPAAPELPVEMRTGVDPTGTMLGRPAGTARVGGSARVASGSAGVLSGAARVPTMAPPSADPNEWTPPLREPKSRPDRENRSRPEPAPAQTGPGRSRRLMIILAAAGIAILILLLGIGGYLLFKDDSTATVKQPTSKTQSVPKVRDISSRDIDPAPLTQQELFPAPQINIGTTAYSVLKGQDGDCQTAASDDLATLLGQVGCTQVVRATLKSPDGQFLITAGIFNLKDKASADQAFNSIKPIVDAQKGRFSGLAAGDGTDAIVRAPTTLGWQPEGHFLAYCIVARTDGKPIPADDEPSKQLITDLVETHLRDKVIGARAVEPAQPPK